MAPPVPKKRGVKLGIWPNFYTYVEDLNVNPSADTKLKFCIFSDKESFRVRGQLLLIASYNEFSL